MKILVADDDPISRRLVTSLVASWGHEAVPVSDGAEAWAALQAATGPLVAILDWMMPGVDGAELCRRLRASPRLVGSYVILLTSRADAASTVEGLDAGADDLLAKPFDRMELKARLGSGLRMLQLQSDLACRIDELQVALAAVDRLQGLLPICCLCKKIRDQQDYWREVEEYVSAHSEVQFSHGMCPECLTDELAELGNPPR